MLIFRIAECRQILIAECCIVIPCHNSVDLSDYIVIGNAHSLCHCRYVIVHYGSAYVIRNTIVVSVASGVDIHSRLYHGVKVRSCCVVLGNKPCVKTCYHVRELSDLHVTDIRCACTCIQGS